MRVGKYLTERNISLSSINNLCEFLHLNHVKMTSLLSEEKVTLLDTNIEANPFLNWLNIRLQLDKIEIEDAKNIIKPLFYNSTTKIDELLGERIINALAFLINKTFYSKAKESLIKVLTADINVLEKISLLKLAEPFIKPKNYLISSKTKRKSHTENGNDFDPYKNFHWGGLHGEEAYIGYWNTD